MSATIIFAFGKDGNIKDSYEISNAFRGAMAVWLELEKRYLPPAIWKFEPEHPTPPNWSRMYGYNDDQAQEVWNLFSNKDVSLNERICLGTTFDNVLVKKEDIKTVISAFKAFGGGTSLPEQAKILEVLADDDDCIAVGWGQTNVCGENWECYECDENGEPICYNCLTGEKHWWLFDELR